jgi:hypothetical protein
MSMTADELEMFEAVRSCLTPDMIPARFQDRSDIPYYGHCFHASIALFKLLGGKRTGYSVRRAIDDAGISHYWLRAPSGYVIDPTVEQYTSRGLVPPYSTSVCTGFRPTRAVQQIVDCVQRGAN